MIVNLQTNGGRGGNFSKVKWVVAKNRNTETVIFQFFGGSE